MSVNARANKERIAITEITVDVQSLEELNKILEENEEESRPYFEKEFDVVCTNNTGFDKLSKGLKILMR